jgi:hypothetical protein
MSFYLLLRIDLLQNQKENQMFQPRLLLLLLSQLHKLGRFLHKNDIVSKLGNVRDVLKVGRLTEKFADVETIIRIMKGPLAQS